MRKTVIPIAAALALAGCASAGTNYDPVKAASVQPGMSRDEVVAMLGAPNAVSTMPDGRQVMVWTHADVNGFTGKSQSRSVSYIFGRDGRVAGPSTTSQMQAKSGL